ncbi:MAG: DUF3131 domain-containing protein [Candidatus Bathyarchaeota archaeon]|nr:DUF3131 domain-containing protein [Candidatus Bathyarchaeota archaeon]
MGFNQKTTIAVAVILIAVIVVPVFAFLNWGNPAMPPSGEPQATNPPQGTSTPTPAPTVNPTEAPTANDKNKDSSKSPDPTPIPRKLGPIESAQTMNSNVWRAVAANAWNYFRPGLGVNATTGLPCSGSSYPYFTDWDMGVYIQAVIDASKLGLISDVGAWGFDDRIERVLYFLENRELNSAGYPYWFYQAEDGGIYRNNSDVEGFVVDTADTGRLLVALHNLRTYDSGFATRINNLVYNLNGDRSNYSKLVPGLLAESLTSTNIYTYYTVYGFACFWPINPQNILDNIYSSGTMNVSGVMLPNATLTSDVLLSIVFETNNTAKLMDLTHQVYLAHEAYYQATGNYRAFGEGASTTTWLYEWVVLPDNRTWTVLNSSGNQSDTTMIFTKVAFGFLALYNTNYSKAMSVHIEHALYSYSDGYGEGVDESGYAIFSTVLHTNGLILDAAMYYCR